MSINEWINHEKLRRYLVHGDGEKNNGAELAEIMVALLEKSETPTVDPKVVDVMNVAFDIEDQRRKLDDEGYQLPGHFEESLDAYGQILHRTAANLDDLIGKSSATPAQVQELYDAQNEANRLAVELLNAGNANKRLRDKIEEKDRRFAKTFPGLRDVPDDPYPLDEAAFAENGIPYVVNAGPHRGVVGYRRPRPTKEGGEWSIIIVDDGVSRIVWMDDADVTVLADLVPRGYADMEKDRQKGDDDE